MSLDATPAAAGLPHAGWEGRLQLGFERRGDRSVLARRLHHGPLTVQRGFYPESDGTCHSYVLHPPGGVVGGDRLSLQVELGAGSKVLLTTPAATKFYRSAGLRAQQRQRLRAGSEAQLEWLPQETIVFDGAELTTHTRIELAAGAAFVGWEILCLGRPESGERFVSGRVEQRLEVFRGERPLVIERVSYAGGGRELDAAWGLRGQPVVATMLCVSGDDRPLEAGLMLQLRALLSEVAGVEAASSQLAGALVCRYLGGRVELAQQAFRVAWTLLRSTYLGKPAVQPRIWAT